MKNEINKQNPLYEHDCHACVYLGRNTYQPMSYIKRRTADVYYCANKKKHIGTEECILVRWSEEPFGFGYFPYFIFYLLRYDAETEGHDDLLKPYLWGLEQAKKRGLLEKEPSKRGI